MNFRINFSKFIDMLLPPMLRQTRQREWLSVLKKPMDDIQQELVTIVDAAKKEVAYQPNKGLVEERLNEQFGVADKIRIVNLAQGRPRIYIGEHKNDNYRMYIGQHNDPRYQLYINQHNGYDPPNFDFEVIIDNDFTLTDDQINVIAVLCVRYSPSKRFRIRHEDGTPRYLLT